MLSTDPIVHRFGDSTVPAGRLSMLTEGPFGLYSRLSDAQLVTEEK